MLITLILNVVGGSNQQSVQQARERTLGALAARHSVERQGGCAQ
jgi:hypothetical protein